LKSASHTEVKSLWSTGLKNEDEDGDDAEEAVWHDEMNYVVQVSASQVKCERGT